MIIRTRDAMACRDIVAGARIVRTAAPSHVILITMRDCPPVVVIGAGALTGTEHRAANPAHVYADAMAVISRIAAVQKIATTGADDGDD